MSEALSVFSIAASTINALGAMAFGATGGVVLGNFSFSGMEVPEFITIGGAQKMTVHTLPGGERIIDLLGHDDRDLEWHGILIDGFPSQRAQILDQMRLDGPALPLQWGDWYFTVIVREFHAETRNSRLHYRICCVVQVNPAAPTTQPEPTTQDAVSSDLGEAQGAAPDAVKPSVASAQQSTPTGAVDSGQFDVGASTVDAGRVDENLGMGEGMGIGMDTATGETVAAPNDIPPTSVGFVDEFGRTQNATTTPAASGAATVGTEGGLVPPATSAGFVDEFGRVQ